MSGRCNVSKSVYRRSLWSTPRWAAIVRRNMSDRSIWDLPSQLRFATSTPDEDRHMCGHLSCENLMGLPGGWTDPDCVRVDEFQVSGGEV